MIRLIPLTLAVALLWLLTATAIWLTPPAERDLVGLRARPPELPGLTDSHPPDLNAALDILAATNIWGTQRDGKPKPPPTPGAQKEAPPAQPWRLAAAVIRTDTRLVLAQSPGQAPVAVHEGEALPDGRTVVSITPSEVVLRDADGVRRTHTLSFE